MVKHRVSDDDDDRFLNDPRQVDSTSVHGLISSLPDVGEEKVELRSSPDRNLSCGDWILTEGACVSMLRGNSESTSESGTFRFDSGGNNN